MAERAPEALPLRRRLVAVGLLVALFVASVVALDRLGPRAIAHGQPAGGPSGAWFCPHGGGQGWRGWVSIADPGPADVRVRLTELTAAGPGTVRSFVVGAGRQVLRSVDASDPSSTTEVEYFGGWVGVSEIVEGGGGPAQLAAAACQSSLQRETFLVDMPTQVGATASVVVMNPFAEPAQFDVVIRTDQRTLAPGPLSPFVLAAHRSAAIRLNDLAEAGADEPTGVVEVRQRLGRVVAGGVDVDDGGIRLVPPVPGVHRAFALPVGGTTAAASLLAFDPGSDGVDLSLFGQDDASEQALTVAGGVSVAAGTVRTVPLDWQRGGVVSVDSTGGQAFVPALRLTADSGRRTSVPAIAEAARSWLVPGAAPPGGSTFLILLAPGATPVTVSYRLLVAGTSSASPGHLTLQPGRAAVVPISAPLRGSTVAILVEAEGTVVAAAASSTTSGGYAVVAGLPMKGATGLAGGSLPSG